MKRKEKTSSIGFGKKKLDIYCLQEAHIQTSKREKARWKSQWGYEAFFSSLDSKSCGVIILFNNTFEYVLQNVISDQQGRYPYTGGETTFINSCKYLGLFYSLY